LIETIADRRRRPNGTVVGGKPQSANPHRFRLTDGGLSEVALPIVKDALEED
jgi:hypothetical protein